MMTVTRGAGETVQALVRGEAPPGEVIELARSGAPLVRVNAFNTLASAARADDELIAELVTAAGRPENAFRLMGTISAAHVAVECLCRVGTPAATAAVAGLLADWPEPDRGDLLWFLRSEGHSPVV